MCKITGWYILVWHLYFNAYLWPRGIIFRWIGNEMTQRKTETLIRTSSYYNDFWLYGAAIGVLQHFFGKCGYYIFFLFQITVNMRQHSYYYYYYNN